MKTHISRYKGNPVADCNLVMLPQNLLTSPGTLIEDFGAATDWTASNCTVADNTTEFRTGTQSVKATSNSASQSTITKTVNMDMSGAWERFTVWFYLHDPIADYGTNSILIYFSNNSGATNAFRQWISPINITSGRWLAMHFHKSDFALVGSGDWASAIIRIQFRFTAASGKTPSISFDSVYTGVVGIPAVILNFDDGYIEQYNNCFAYMKPLGIRGTLWSDTHNIDQANMITSAELLEMDAAGWVIGNHTNSATDLSGLSEANQETQILGGKTALLGLGLSKGVNYLDFPSGGYNTDTNTAMANLGVLAARTTKPSLGSTGVQKLALPFGDILHTPSNTTTGQSIATLIGFVDNAISYKYILSLHLHEVGGADLSIANFQTLMDYIYTKWKAGLITPITIDDYYKLTLGPVKVPR
jgi:peptidoglycan/xylan/chitin deacetylase (PgdA/CDA1 family)